MEVVIEAILQVLLEIVLQVFGEALAEFGWHCVAEAFERRPNPWMAALGYAILGAGVGAVSSLLVPALIASPGLRIANLAITPLVAGGTTSMIGAWRRRRGQDLIRLDRFGYGYLFALSMALARLYLAN